MLYAVAEFCGNVELCRLTEQVVFSDPYNKVSQYNHWTSLILLVMLRLFKRIMFSSLKLLSWNLRIVPAHCCHFLFVTCSSAIVSSVIWDIKEFLFLKILWESPGSSTWRSPHWFCHGYSWVNSSFRSGISILWAYGFWYGNLILAFFAQDGHADQVNDRKVCPVAVTACVFIFSSEK